MARLLSLLALTTTLTVGCTEGQKTNPLKRAPEDSARPGPGKRSLYDRLGGEQAIARVVEDFIANVKADPNIRKKHKDHFDMGDVAALKKKLIDQIGEATGGPQKYTGKNMRDAHRGMEISNADFDALVGDLRKALDDNKVAPADRDELLKMLDGMRNEVVEQAGP